MVAVSLPEMRLPGLLCRWVWCVQTISTKQQEPRHIAPIFPKLWDCVSCRDSPLPVSLCHFTRTLPSELPLFFPPHTNPPLYFFCIFFTQMRSRIKSNLIVIFSVDAKQLRTRFADLSQFGPPAIFGIFCHSFWTLEGSLPSFLLMLPCTTRVAHRAI